MRVKNLLFPVCIIACSFTSSLLGEQPDAIIDLWPDTPPGEKIDVGDEQDFTKDSDALIAGRRIIKLGNVKRPQAHVFLPPANIRTGASVVICPGGGFSILAWDLEGTEVAQWLTQHGIAAVVLKYRVPTRNQTPAWLQPTQDAQRTLSLLRSRAADWKLDKDKIGILGFSAGGVTAFKTTLAEKRLYDPVDKADEEDCVPNRTILIYSGGLPSNTEEQTLKELNITAKTPPIFMAHAFDDFVPVQGAAQMLLAMKKVGVPSELHVYDAGGHGYGLRVRDDLPVTSWTSPCVDWLRRAGWVYTHKVFPN